MKFIVDESTGMAVVDYLRSLGHDVSSVSEMMPRAHDKAILTKAKEEHRTLITWPFAHFKD